jgi:cell division protein FtsI (penicillin-binding protein 3)
MTLTWFVLAALRGACVLGAALAAMVLLRRASAATRRLVLVLAFVAVALLPIATAVVPPLHVRGAASATTDRAALAIASTPDPVAEPRAVEDGVATAAASRATRARESSAWRPSLAQIVFALWALGAAAVLARLGVGMSRARRLARDARHLEGRSIGGRWVQIRSSAAIETPAVTGVLSPVILLPREAAGWTAERRELVLAHELAHVARHDCLAHIIVQVACALHWFDPLAWLAARRLRTERELAADDRVLAGGARASSYAEHLLALATMHVDPSVPAGALALAEPSQVVLRIRALLSADRSRAPLGRARLAIVGACGIALAAAVAGATPDRAPARAASPPDASGKVVRRGGAALDGIAGELTLDPALQAIAEDETDRLVADWQPRAATVVILDPRTGEVLAMTSRASDPKVEVAAQRAYTPGSTIKPFVVAAALEEGAIQPTQTFGLQHGMFTYDGHTFHDASTHRALDVAGILAVSSNVGMVKIFDALGGARLATWTQRFHLAGTAPVQLPDVAAGAVPARIDDHSSSGAAVAIGEGVRATPIQLAASFAALANGGVYHAPTLIKHADAGDRVLTQATATTVLAMLEGVVDGPDGTGKAARVDGVRVAGKTGTAQLARGEYYASFVGAAPLEHPRYVILVAAEAPHDHGSGGKVAAPVAGRILKRALAR